MELQTVEVIHDTWYDANCHTLQSGTETGSPKHVFFFIGVTVRLQSRDIQVIDSDTHLCTRRFYTEEVKHLQNRKKHVKGGARYKINIDLFVGRWGIKFYYQYYGGRYRNIHAMFHTGDHTSDGTSVTTYHHLLLSQSNKTTAWSHITLISASSAPLRVVKQSISNKECILVNK